jgi:hypothetical protein
VTLFPTLADELSSKRQTPEESGETQCYSMPFMSEKAERQTYVGTSHYQTTRLQKIVQLQQNYKALKSLR